LTGTDRDTVEALDLRKARGTFAVLSAADAVVLAVVFGVAFAVVLALAVVLAVVLARPPQQVPGATQIAFSTSSGIEALVNKVTAAKCPLG
jgi:hypothetical protein